MKTLPHDPYLRNINAEYCRQNGLSYDELIEYDEYIEWLGQFGFKIPMDYDELEFPDDFSDRDLTLFILRWA